MKLKLKANKMTLPPKKAVSEPVEDAVKAFEEIAEQEETADIDEALSHNKGYQEYREAVGK